MKKLNLAQLGLSAVVGMASLAIGSSAYARTYRNTCSAEKLINGRIVSSDFQKLEDANKANYSTNRLYTRIQFPGVSSILTLTNDHVATLDVSDNGVIVSSASVRISDFGPAGYLNVSRTFDISSTGSNERGDLVQVRLFCSRR